MSEQVKEKRKIERVSENCTRYIPNCVSEWASKRVISEWASKREEKNRESQRKLYEIYSEKENSEWKKKKKVFFCSSCIFKCCNLYLI